MGALRKRDAQANARSGRSARDQNPAPRCIEIHAADPLARTPLLVEFQLRMNRASGEQYRYTVEIHVKMCSS